MVSSCDTLNIAKVMFLQKMIGCILLWNETRIISVSSRYSVRIIREFFSRPSVDIALARMVAKLVDLGLLLILFPFLNMLSIWASTLLAVVYWIVIDFCFKKRSPGKWILGLKVVGTVSGKEPGWKSFFVRNFLLTLATVLYCFPFWGWYVNLVIIFPAILVEMVLMYVMSSKTRLMDILTDTRVTYENDDSQPAQN